MATTAMGGNTALEAYIDPSIIELSNKSSKKRSRDSTEDGGLTDKKKRKREKEKQRTETREQVVRVGDELAEKSERKKKKKKKVLAQVETSSTAIPNPTAQGMTRFSMVS
jgi:spore cortex formation protein SpoVR/YcgB (stage V sporulation)